MPFFGLELGRSAAAPAGGSPHAGPNRNYQIKHRDRFTMLAALLRAARFAWLIVVGGLLSRQSVG